MKISLQELFESNKNQLSTKLAGFSLPKDFDAVYKTVYDYFNEIFNNESEFRQNLTQSEDYILQTAISLLSAQRELANSFNYKKIEEQEEKEEPEQKSNCEKSLISKYSNSDSAKVMIGSGVGAIAGKIFFGGWGAVFGALAGTALAIYISSTSKSTNISSEPLKKMNIQPSYSVNVDAFLSTISSVCASVDNLLDTFRAQINNVVQKYESQPKPTLDSNYLPLLESIQSLVGFTRTHSEEEEKYIRKLKERIEDLSDVIDTWNLKFIDFDGSNTTFFEMIPSEKSKEKKMVCPAIMKDNNVIVKGKVFVPMK